MKRKQLKIIVAMFLLVGLSLFYSGRKVEAASMATTVKSSMGYNYNLAGNIFRIDNYWRTIYYNQYCYRSDQGAYWGSNGIYKTKTTAYYYSYR